MQKNPRFSIDGETLQNFHKIQVWEWKKSKKKKK